MPQRNHVAVFRLSEQALQVRARPFAAASAVRGFVFEIEWDWCNEHMATSKSTGSVADKNGRSNRRVSRESSRQSSCGGNKSNHDIKSGHVPCRSSHMTWAPAIASSSPWWLVPLGPIHREGGPGPLKGPFSCKSHVLP